MPRWNNSNCGFQKGHKSFLTTAIKKKIKDTLKRKGIRPIKPKTGPMAETTKRKISKTHKARKENYPNWKGGITAFRAQIRNSFEYRQWRSDVFTRDDFACQQCGARSGNGEQVYLEAHHIKEFSKILEKYNIRTLEQALNCAELWNINNGITLCEKCHYKTKKFGKKL